MKIKIPKNKSSQKLTIHSSEYVNATELFKNCNRALAAFAYAILHKKIEFDCSWGNNQKTLIDSELIANALTKIDRSKREDDPEVELLDLEVLLVLDRIDKMPNNVYVNLED